MSKTKELPSVDYLNECFFLLGNGSLVWKDRPQSHFPKRDYQFKIWNRAYSGRVADVDMLNGYYAVCINGVRYKSHRVVYAIVNNGICKDYQIDHKNGNGKDNRPENLRLATQSQNTINFKGGRKDNFSGCRGISWKERNKKWQAQICHKGVNKYLGLFARKEDAIKASSEARRAAFGEFWVSQNE